AQSGAPPEEGSASMSGPTFGSHIVAPLRRRTEPVARKAAVRHPAGTEDAVQASLDQARVMPIQDGEQPLDRHLSMEPIGSRSFPELFRDRNEDEIGKGGAVESGEDRDRHGA